ncbi:AAA family ATPase [uncultured Thiocystis sp.]|uniref:AAA family ATPase n=1 Tax=uncultured Thiocystis sp. TaxID=1202134 RepID=UPI0025D214F7|nr:AAA family ATPase [uncultured Thiocystis sp.]
MRHGEGFVVVSGKPGTGKTTLIDDLLGDLDHSGTLSVRLESAQVQGDDLLRRVAFAFGIEANGLDKATILNSLEGRLQERMRHHEKTLLIVDEAQTLPASALEELRLMTNLRLQGRPLLQIFLVGQEALTELIRTPELEQLHQRILCACHLEPLPLEETRNYIAHRLLCAGWSGDPVIEADAVRALHHASQGIPRLINKFAGRLLLHACLEGLHRLGREHVQTILAELSDEQLLKSSSSSERQPSFNQDAEVEIADIAMDTKPAPPPAAQDDRRLDRLDAQTPAVADTIRETPPPPIMFAAAMAPEEGVHPESSLSGSARHPAGRRHGRWIALALVVTLLPALAFGLFALKPRGTTEDAISDKIDLQEPPPANGANQPLVPATPLVSPSVENESVEDEMDIQAESGIAETHPPPPMPLPEPPVLAEPVAARQDLLMDRQASESAPLDPSPRTALDSLENMPAESTDLKDRTLVREIVDAFAQLGIKSIEVDDGIRINFGGSMPFDFDSAQITPRAIPRLQELIALLARFESARVEIHGYTDDVGDAAHNRELSLLRARALKEYLTAGGISPDRVIAIGHGEEFPLFAPGDGSMTAEQRLLNRRIELIIHLP